MKRLIAIAAVGAALVAAGAGSESGDAARYTVELDSAFGLVDGGDLKLAGVRAGVIESVRLDRRSKRALVGIRIDEPGFGELRSDARCEVRPQSLLGEYFLDCLPGTASRVLARGSRIGVEQTASTIAPDLVTSIVRRPYAERLRLIVSSLGAGLAGNGERLNDALRRAVPALRQTDRVLGLLARQERVIDALVRDADEVFVRIDRRRADVGRFVDETEKASRTTAERRRELRAALAAAPEFVRELAPTMRALGSAAARGEPALRALRGSAEELRRLLRNLPPLGAAAAPALTALGRAAETGRPALRPAHERVRELAPVAAGAPELLSNLAIVLGHLDNRDNAVEDDPRSPGGQGYTGLEAVLRYLVYQTLVANSFDAEMHIVNAAFFESRCLFYTDLDALKADPTLERECASRLGPNQAGITVADPTAPPARRRRAAGTERSALPPPGAPVAPAPLLHDAPPLPLPALRPTGPVLESVDRIADAVTQLGKGLVSPPPGPRMDLLDFLLGR